MSQTETIEMINRMNNEQQISFYNSLRNNGFTESDIRTIQSLAFYTKLLTEPDAYMAVRKEMGRQLYKEFTNQ